MSGKKSKTIVKLSEKELDQLWGRLKSATPEEQRVIVESLDPEVITQLRSRGNPYKKPVYLGDANKQLAFSILNIREKYYQRFAVTSVIAFLYRMVTEYQPDPPGKLISENDAEFANIVNKKIKRMVKSRPIEMLNSEITGLLGSLETTSDMKTKADVHIKLAVAQLKLAKYRFWLIKRKLVKYNERVNASSRDISKYKADINEFEKRYDEFDKKKKLLSDPGANIPELRLKKLIGDADNLDRCEKVFKVCREAIDNIEKKLIDANIKHDELSMSRDSVKNNYDTCENELKTCIENFKRVTRGKLKSSDQNPPSFTPDENDIEKIIEETKRELNINETLEDYHNRTQDTVIEFLNKFLVYNPDLHVQRADCRFYKDFLATPGSSERIKSDPEASAAYAFVPPRDTFTRLNRYINEHYEYLRQATDDIYAERSDFEFAIAPLETFSAQTPESTKSQFDEFKKKYANEFESEVYNASFGRWNFLGSWAPNRENREIYSRGTEIMQEILSQADKDVKNGDAIAKKRAIKGRKDKPETFENFQKINPPGITQHGVKQVKAEDIPRDHDESTDKQLEVLVTEIKPIRDKKRFNRIRGFVNQFHFNVESDEATPDNVNVESAALFKKKMMTQ